MLSPTGFFFTCLFFWVREVCCYSIFDPCFDKFSEKPKIAKKNNENPKNAFLIYLHRF